MFDLLVIESCKRNKILQMNMISLLHQLILFASACTGEELTIFTKIPSYRMQILYIHCIISADFNKITDISIGCDYVNIRALINFYTLITFIGQSEELENIIWSVYEILQKGESLTVKLKKNEIY